MTTASTETILLSGKNQLRPETGMNTPSSGLQTTLDRPFRRFV